MNKLQIDLLECSRLITLKSRASSSFLRLFVRGVGHIERVLRLNLPLSKLLMHGQKKKDV